MANNEGEVFGRYQLVSRVGSGGMAQVHLAHQTGPDRFVKPCVLKRIAPEQRGDAQVRRMFLEEARVSALLNHPHIVQTFDYGTVGDEPFLAMELVDGVNLAQLLRQLARDGRWLSLGAALDIVAAVLDALDYAHQLKDLDGKALRIVHRDVSPQNILLSRQGGVKLADFGIARHEAREEVTQVAATKGKPGYMAPEQALGEPVDGRADIFAVGVVLTELVSARRLRLSAGRTLPYRQLAQRVPALFGLRKDLPPGLLECAVAMTALEAKDRPPTARAAAERVRAIAAVLPAKEPLARFLQAAFAQTFPEAGERTLVDSPLPTPPEDDQVRFDQASWTAPSPELAAKPDDISEKGWPTQFREDRKLDLVARSSSVDAMQYFAAHTADGAPTGRADPEPAAKPAAPSPKLPPPAAEPLAPAIPKSLGLGEQIEKPPEGSGLRGLLLLVLAGVVVAAAGVGVLALVRGWITRAPAQTAPARGRLTVVTQPPGAEIFIDRQPTGQRSPAEIGDLPLDRAIAVSVRKAGHLSRPVEAQLTLTAYAPHVGASFTLRRGRSFTVESTPAGAVVTMNGQKQRGVTPLELPVVPFGESATVAVVLEGHLPAELLLHARAETPTVSAVVLEPGAVVDVVSDPPGAEVRVDRHVAGTTPLYELTVPAGRGFKLSLRKRGYKPWTRAMNTRKLGGRLIEVDLQALPLLALPMARAELVQARELDRRHSGILRDLTRGKLRLAQAEKQLRALEARPDFFMGKLQAAEARVQTERAALEALEEARREVEQEIDELRESLLDRLDAQAN